VDSERFPREVSTGKRHLGLRCSEMKRLYIPNDWKYGPERMLKDVKFCMKADEGKDKTSKSCPSGKDLLSTLDDCIESTIRSTEAMPDNNHELSPLTCPT
jgi:hypothetical protein